MNETPSIFEMSAVTKIMLVELGFPKLERHVNGIVSI